MWGPSDSEWKAFLWTIGGSIFAGGFFLGLFVMWVI